MQYSSCFKRMKMSDLEARDPLLKTSYELCGIIGRCPSMQKIFADVRKVACSDIPVLVQGESGVGKQAVARAIHASSRRGKAPFIPVHAGSVSERFLNLELFGHERGDSPHAPPPLKGKMECANSGVLFIREIDFMPASLQPKLLRFLKEGTIRREGSAEEIPVDTRLLTASETDMKTAVEEGRFPEDLYYRISPFTFKIPPLRERGNDILILAEVFLERFNARCDKAIQGFTPAALEVLTGYPWPGNIREMENRILRGVILCDSFLIDVRDLGLAAGPSRRSLEKDLRRHMASAALAGHLARAAMSGAPPPCVHSLP